MHSISAPAVTTYFVNANPLQNVTHTGEIPVGSSMKTGQPLVVCGTVQQDVIDLMFSTYDENDDSNNVMHDVSFSVYTDQAAAQAVVDDLNSVDFLKVSMFKHPTLEEWAIASQSQVFAAIPDGDAKTRLIAAATLSITEGRVKDTATMVTNGWQ